MRKAVLITLTLISLLPFLSGGSSSETAVSSSSEGYSAGTFPLKTNSFAENCPGAPGADYLIRLAQGAHFKDLSGTRFTFTVKDDKFTPEFMLLCAYRDDELVAWHKGEGSTKTLTMYAPDVIDVWVPRLAVLSDGGISQASTGHVHMSSS